MMNKNLLSLAVATALAAPALVAPSTASAEAILYGKINVSVDYIDVQQNATYFRPGNTVGPQFNANQFFYGAGNTTAPSQAVLNQQQTNLQNALGTVPIFGAYRPNGLGGGVAGGTFGNTNPVTGTPFAPAVATQLANTANAVYQTVYNSQIAAGQTAAVATIVATAQTDSYTNPANPLYGTNLVAAQTAAAALAATTAANGGAIAFNQYITQQATALQTSLRSNQLTVAQAAQANTLLAMAVGANGNTGMMAAGLRAQALASTRAGQKFSGWGMDTSNAVNGPASRVGVKGSEDLGGGLKAIYQIEIGVDITNANRDYNLTNGNRGTSAGVGATANTSSASGFSFRNTFVGLASEWGTVLLGRHDSPLKISTAKLDLFADTLADNNATIGFQDLRADNAFAYITPNWSGFQLMMAAVPQNASTPILLTGLPDSKATSFAGLYSVAATYKNGPFFGSVAYESLGKSNFSYDDPYYQLLYQNKTAKNDTKLRIGLGLLDWNGFTLTGIYEQRNNINGAPMRSNGNYFQIQGGYAFGNNFVKAMWGQADLQQCADPNGVGFRYTCQSSLMGQYFVGAGAPLLNNAKKSAWAIGYDYNFSKRTTAFALYTAMTDKINTSNWSGFSFGMMHSF